MSFFVTDVVPGIYVKSIGNYNGDYMKTDQVDVLSQYASLTGFILFTIPYENDR